MIKHKDVPEDKRGIYCPIDQSGGYCCGAACAWWVDDDERHGHCAALDWGRGDAESRADAPTGGVNAYVPCPMPEYDGYGRF